MTAKSVLTMIVASLAVAVLSPAALAQAKYVSVGIGGGGAMYEPASSPHDPKLMFVSCDMGGLYRSEDGGASWTMLDFRNIGGNTQCRPAFHPTKANVIYFGAKMSEDAGKTWKDIPGAPFKGNVTRIALDPTGKIIVVGTQDGAFLSRDEGKSWERCEGVKGKVVGVFLWRRLLIATQGAIYRSEDDGKTWTEACNGLPWRDIRSFTGAHAPENPRMTVPSLLFCTIPSKNENGKFAGGIYRSNDSGKNWYAMGDGLNIRIGKVDEWGSGEVPQYHRIEAAPGNYEVVYVTCTGTGYWPPYQDTVYRSDDASNTWRMVQFFDFRFTKARTPDYKGIAELNFEHGWLPYTITWNWGGLPGTSGFTVNERNPDVVMAVNGGELFVTTDGGKLWKQAYTKYAPGQEPPAPTPGERPGRWESIGLEVTTCWNYRIDPNNHKNHFICYTDIGLFRSEDGGLTWTDSNKGSPWGGNTFDIVFDPERKGRAWAAMSAVHDIPHWTYVHEEVKGPGGVCVSDDGGKTWKASCEGLPSAPITSLVLDPKSPAASRTLYCTAFGAGVFKSTDDGKSWKSASNGIDLKTNDHAFLVQLHPSGALFACVTAKRGPGRGGNTYSRPGGLYRSTDGGDTWTDITASNPLYWPTGFAVHPQNPDVIYLAAHTATRREDGGIYKTTDGGKTWTRLLRNEDFQGKGGPSWATSMFVTMDPKDPETLYMGTDGHGLWISHDGAKSWKQLEGMPFASVHRVTFDPARQGDAAASPDDANKVYITTFGGGVWKGPRP